MDKISVLFPHMMCLLIILLYLATILVWDIISGIIMIYIFNWKRAGNSAWPNTVWRMSQQTWERLILAVISIVAFLFVVLYLVPWIFSSSFHIAPSENWQKKAKQADAALIFGFGYGINEQGDMTPESSNQFLYDLARLQVSPRYFIMQEGVFVASMKDTTKHKVKKYTPIRMHPCSGLYLNTCAAAQYAIKKMDSLDINKVVVYAHNMQLKRAITDLRKIASHNPKLKSFEFIVPAIPDTPFPKKSFQWHTRFKVVYRAIELYISRVRDAWCN